MSPNAATKAAVPPASLTGVEKVAVLLLALGKARAAKLLRRFDQEELKLLSQSIGELRPITGAELEALVEEFGHMLASGVNFVGSAAEIRRLLSGVVPDEEVEPEGAAGPEGKPKVAVWEKVSRLKIEVLRAYLLKEHPQTSAFILSRIDPDAAAKAITSFPQESRAELLCRMLSIKSVSDSAVQIVEARLAQDLVSSTASASHATIAEILNRLEKSQSDAVLESLAAVRPNDAKALKRLLFNFEDLATLPPAARTAVLDRIPLDRLVLALRGTEAAFKDAILSALASRSRRMVEAELQGGSTASPREIKKARRTIVDAVLKMIAKGEIELPSPDDLDDITG
jgi:flagellar motor switch protein FliG